MPKLGRKPPVRTRPRLRLSPHIDTQVPPNPAMVDWLAAVRDWPMYLNDQLGDCTIAGVGHIIEALSTYGQGQTVEITDQQVLAAYEAVSGYDPATGQHDDGAVMQDVLNYWRKQGIGGHKILAFAEVDVSRRAEVDAAINVFGHVYLGFNFPAVAMRQFDQGLPWDVVPDDGGLDGGHAVNAGRYSSPDGNVTVVTWGQIQQMTDAFWDRYVDEAWVAITPEWLDAAGHSPAGLDLYGLGEDLAQLTGGQNPFPAPEPPGPPPGPPPPAPGPVPVADPDRAAAKAIRYYKQRPLHTRHDREVLMRALTAWLHAKGL